MVGVKTFLVTSFGKPFTPAGFGNWMRERCDGARLPECSSHGLMASITGHKTLKEVERYSEKARQKLMAEMAMRGLDITRSNDCI